MYKFVLTIKLINLTVKYVRLLELYLSLALISLQINYSILIYTTKHSHDLQQYIHIYTTLN
jgi:hypothetical protein